MEVKDLFSGNASDYAAFRPDYPQEFFDFIFQHVNQFDAAWDCGTGNGQAAKVLASKFKKVFATDISDKQMANGYKASNIFYSVCPAEQTSFVENQFDLITVAQAAHWFRLSEFYAEVKRVIKPDGLLAIWGYGVLSINPEFDTCLQNFYKNVIGSFWDPERKHIDLAYQSIPFPFEEIAVPEFHFTKQWTIAQLGGYLTTWSAVQKYIKAKGTNPVTYFIKSVEPILSSSPLEIRFPLFARVGYVVK